MENNIEKNKADYAEFYNELTFATPEQAYQASLERERHIEFLKQNARWGFNRTKVDVTALSPGCQLCGEGDWSCLFINNTCNANCFYCPTPQNEESNPTTQTVEFQDVEDYIAYIRKFNFKGVSISGGEPFLTFDKSILFIERIREALGDEIYLWLYTNGILADEEKLKKLKEAGLNEIRFDIGATGYKTDKVEMACKIIDTVTVEIPAVPEEYERMKELMVQLSEMGVKHLNLHQIRCTPHNYKRLVKRGYTFLHGPRITVLESELTALRLVRFGIESNIPLAVNYCSFIYKHRYQRLAARRKFAPEISETYEDITETGMIRTFYIKGEQCDIFELMNRFSEMRIPEMYYKLKGDNDTLYLKSCLWDELDLSLFKWFIGYSSAFILPGVSYRNMFKELRISNSKKIVVERANFLKPHELSKEEKRIFEELFIKNRESEKDYRHIDTILQENNPKCKTGMSLHFLTNAYECERLRWGLLDYY